MKIPMEQIKANKRKLFACLMGIIIVLLVLGIFVGGKIKHVSVVGCNYYTEDEIKEKVLNSSTTKNTFGLYFTYAFGKGVSIPFVSEIDVSIEGINSVEILIVEKSTVGCIRYMGEYLYFDGEGVVVESSTEHKKGIPVIEGVHFKKMNLYEPLEVDDEEIFNKIMGISQLLTKYNIQIDKVLFDAKGKVVLYVKDIRVKLGKKDRYDVQIAELSNLLPKAVKKKLKGVLDMENFSEGQNKIIFQMDEEKKKVKKKKEETEENLVEEGSVVSEGLNESANLE